MNRSNIYLHGVDHNARTSNRADNDYYSTTPEAVEYLLEYENFDKNILEPCIGGGGYSRSTKKTWIHSTWN
jgi:hypothetical protein